MKNWYNFFKQSISEKYVKMLQNNFDIDELPFEDIFQEKTRMVIPFANNQMLEIINKLENGNTKSKSSYTVNIQDNSAIKNDDQAKRKRRLGKVIQKELSQKELDTWSYHASSSNKNLDEDYSIILSRNPVDIIRMSDYDGIKSCHSENGSYFQCAIEEASEGGFIAYVVRSSDLSKINLENPEIFADESRHVEGIEPISRLRISRYSDRKNRKEYAIPLNKIYGEKLTGFQETILQWCQSVQKDKFNFDNLPDIKDLVRHGGSYPDATDGVLLNLFFKTDKYKGNTVHTFDGKTTRNMSEIWEEEISQYDKEYNKYLKYFSCSANIEGDADESVIYLYSSLFFEFENPNYIDENQISKSILKDRSLLNDITFDLRDHYEIDNMQVFEDDNFIKLNFDLRIDLYEEMTPDKYSEVLKDYISYEATSYSEAKYKIYTKLVEMGVLDNTVYDKFKIFSYVNNDIFSLNIPYSASNESLENDNQVMLDKTLNDSIIEVKLNNLKPIVTIGRIVDTAEFSQELQKRTQDVLQMISNLLEKENYEFDLWGNKIQNSPNLMENNFSIEISKSYENITPYLSWKIDLLDNSIEEITDFIRSVNGVSNSTEIIKKEVNKILLQILEKVFLENDTWWSFIRYNLLYFLRLPENVQNNPEVIKKSEESYYNSLNTQDLFYHMERFFNNGILNIKPFYNATLKFIKNLLLDKNNLKKSVIFKRIKSIIKNLKNNQITMYNEVKNDIEEYDNIIKRELNNMIENKLYDDFYSEIYYLLDDEEEKKMKEIAKKYFLQNLTIEDLYYYKFPEILSDDKVLIESCYNFLIRSGYSNDQIAKNPTLANPIVDYAINEGI